MKNAKLLVVVIVLQSLALVGMWVGQSSSTARAEVQLPNPGERQMQIIEELKGINGKLDKLNSLLQSGDVKVKTDKNDKK
jgi:hypothetical protein